MKMETKLEDLDSRNTSEHQTILSEVREIKDSIKCFATQKDLNIISRKTDKNERNIANLFSWLYWLLGVGAIVSFLVVLFKEKIIK